MFKWTFIKRLMSIYFWLFGHLFMSNYIMSIYLFKGHIIRTCSVYLVEFEVNCI